MKNVLSPVDFREMRERLFQLLQATTRKFEDSVVVDSEKVFLTPEGSVLVAKLMLHLITVKGTKVSLIAATDDIAFPIVGSIIALAGNTLQGGLLLKSLINGPATTMANGAEAVLITDRIVYNTTGHIDHLRSHGYKVDTVLTIVNYHRPGDNQVDRWIASAGLNMITIFDQSEFEEGQLDHTRFHLFQDAQMFGIG